MIERYIGGGKIFISRFNGTDYDAEVEIGEVKEAKMSIAQNYAEATSKDTGVSKKVDKVATSTDAKISFTTQNVNKENMAMAMFGSLATETFSIGDTLPDGTVATSEITIPVIDGGTLSKIEAKIKIVGENVSGDSNPVLLVHHAVIIPTGDARDYFSDNHATIGFDCEIMEIDEGYFKEYFIPKQQ